MTEKQQSIEVNQESIQKPKKQNSRGLLVIIALVFSSVFFFFGFSIGKNQQTTPVSFDLAKVENKNTNDEVDFALFWDVWDLVKEKYVDHDSLEAQAMINGAINGMLAATGDPYTVFLDEKKFADLNEELNGSFEGIGAEVGIKDDILTIVTPLLESPAEKAGLRAGDKVAEIDGQTTADMTIDEAVDKMRGTKGTELHLKIYREDDDGMMESQDITVVRDTIHIDSVRVDFLDNDIAHIKLIQFGGDTIKEFNKIIAQLKQNNTKGIILDMRNDPGGILHTAVVLASKFLPNNAVVVMEEDANGDRTNLYTSGAYPLLDVPVVVLVNEGSASASEILAGALRDNREDVVIIGKQSFGKGSVQELIPMSGSTAAKITVAKWLTPSGEQINEVGITPDVEVEYTNEDFKNDLDPQLDKAIEIMIEKLSQNE